MSDSCWLYPCGAPRRRVRSRCSGRSSPNRRSVSDRVPTCDRQSHAEPRAAERAGARRLRRAPARSVRTREIWFRTWATLRRARLNPAASRDNRNRSFSVDARVTSMSDTRWRSGARSCSIAPSSSTIAGADALAFAHAQFCERCRRARPATWQWSAWLTAQGRVRSAYSRCCASRTIVCCSGCRSVARAAMRDALARFVLRAKVRISTCLRLGALRP